MNYETIIEQVKTVPKEKLKELEAFILLLKDCEHKKSCRGIAAEYANPDLIQKENDILQSAFLGEMK